MKTNRNYNLIHQAKVTFFLKAFSVLLPLITTPLLLKLLGQKDYGVWSVVLSFIAWLTIFDLGLGHTLKNRFTELVFRKDVSGVNRELSQSITVLFFISIFSFLTCYIVFFISGFLYLKELWLILLLAFVNVVTSPLYSLTYALKKSYFKEAVSFVSNFLLFVFLFYVNLRDIKIDVFYLLSFLVSVNVIVNILLAYYILNISGANLLNHSLLFNNLLTYVKKIAPNAFHFFSIQVSYIILYFTDRYIISQMVGIEYVAEYDIIYKIISVYYVIQSFLSSPLWASYSNAMVEYNYKWCKQVLKKQVMFFLALSIAALGTAYFIDDIIKFWIGSDFEYNYQTVFYILIYVVAMLWNSVFSVFLNATGNVKVQNIISIISSSVNIPLSLFLSIYLNMGLNGVILGTILSILPFSIIGPCQSYKLLKE